MQATISPETQEAKVESVKPTKDLQENSIDNKCLCLTLTLGVRQENVQLVHMGKQDWYVKPKFKKALGLNQI